MASGPTWWERADEDEFALVRGVQTDAANYGHDDDWASLGLVDTPFGARSVRYSRCPRMSDRHWVAFEETWAALSLGTAGPPVDVTATMRADTLLPFMVGPRRPVSTPPDAGDVSELPTISFSLPPSSAARAELEAKAVLGEGGMGVVYLGRQRSLSRDVAVKVVRPETRSDAAVAALLREARVTGALEHPNIVPVHLLGHSSEGDALLVLKRIEGVAWRDLLRDPAHPMWKGLVRGEEDRLTMNVDVLVQVANALDFAHSRGVVHRDVKPENVMVGPFGEVYLLDWGIALVLAEGHGAQTSPVGTPGYMAPEMLAGAGDRVDARTDVYLLGTTLHEVLTGEPRHHGPTLRDVFKSVFESLPYAYANEVPAELAALCNAATSRDPALRPQSAAEFRRALTDFLGHRGSRSLGAAATARLAELRALLGDGDTGRAAILEPRAGELMTECRFGFLSALREWPANASARAGLVACLELATERALAQRNPDAVRAALADMPEPRPDLLARLDALEHALRDEREGIAELRQHRYEMDSDVSARLRVVAYWTILAIGLVVFGVMVARADGEVMPARDLLPVDAALALAATVVLFVGRRRLFANAYNRRLVGLALAMIGLGSLVDGYATIRGLGSDVAGIYAMLTTAAILAAGAVASLPRLAWGALATTACAIVGTLAPRAINALGMATLVIAVVTLLGPGKPRPTALDHEAAGPASGH